MHLRPLCAHLKVLVKLSLSIALAHTLAARASALDGSKDTIDVARSAPFLVRQNLTADVLLPTLDQVDICLHAVGLECSRKLGGDSCVGVQACKGNEL